MTETRKYTIPNFLLCAQKCGCELLHENNVATLHKWPRRDIFAALRIPGPIQKSFQIPDLDVCFLPLYFSLSGVC